MDVEYMSRWIDSPIGPMRLTVSERGLCEAHWDDEPIEFESKINGTPTAKRLLTDVERQLNQYFAGKRTQFEIPLDLKGTAFQREVWDYLFQKIPHGTTQSYRQVAVGVGRPLASRAVGAAIGRNPVGIIVPCHRVIGANGSLTGFGGGLHRKEFLLRHEGILQPR